MLPTEHLVFSKPKDTNVVNPLLPTIPSVGGFLNPPAFSLPGLPPLPKLPPLPPLPVLPIPPTMTCFPSSPSRSSSSTLLHSVPHEKNVAEP